MPKAVLIVEDNELNMKLFHDLLDAHGYDTLQTKDGMEALAIAREKRPDHVGLTVPRARRGPFIRQARCQHIGQPKTMLDLTQ
jgi:CheY-like chemotaxis protein